MVKLSLWHICLEQPSYIALLRPCLCAVRGWGDPLLACPACREAVDNEGKVGESTAKSLVNSDTTNTSVFVLRFWRLKLSLGLGSGSRGWWLAVVRRGEAAQRRTVRGAGAVGSL